jgi:hypothetical protein
MILCVLFISTATFTLTSCDDNDNNDVSQTVIAENLKSGTWRVTSYMDSGDNETSHFDGFNFDFEDAGIVTATNGNVIYPGTWNISDEDNDDDSLNDLDLNLVFLLPDDFAELTDGWEFVSQSSTRVELKHVSSGSGGTDYLTLQKN